jgi:hypothetical protein
LYESNWVYRKKYAFILKYVPDYLYGDSTSGIFDKIINEDFYAGKILQSKENLIIGCKNGSLSLLKVQKAGGKPMEIKEFLRGNKFEDNKDFV